jgi:hypothetical protein
LVHFDALKLNYSLLPIKAMAQKPK